MNMGESYPACPVKATTQGIGVRASAFTFQTLETTKILKNFYHKGASNQGSEVNENVESSAFPFLFRLVRLRGGSFLQELYDFEKILAVKKVNVDALALAPQRLIGRIRYLRRKPGMNNSNTVKSSRRPTIIKNEKPHLT
jgi:hypothetical protein